MNKLSYSDYLKQAKTVKLAKNFTLFDVANSSNAILHNIDNTPPAQIVSNAGLLIKNVLQPLTDHFKTRPDVSCIYRCPALNKLVGGVASSQHAVGEAADFTIIGQTLPEIIYYIRHNLVFDQLILEKTWIHCSYTHLKNRGDVLKNINGKYVAI